jgi:Tfp pilus assembly protein FimT
MPAPSTSSSLRNWQDRRAFTLTELLIVIVLIIIILGIAIPTLSVLTGSRSTESAKNQLAAMLGRARGLAIQNNATVGLAIYVDPINGQTDLALVQMISLTGPTAYQAWTYFDAAAYPMYQNGVLNPAGGNVNYQPGDIVFRLSDNWTGLTATNFPTERLPSGAIKKTVKTFVCSQAHIAGTGNEPGIAGGDQFWNAMLPNSIDLLPPGQGAVEQLPRGVAVELINDSASTALNGTDQYVHTGVILFDSTGKLTVSTFFIVPGSSLDTAIVSSAWGTPIYIPQINPAKQSLIYSNIGVAIYDSTAIADQSFFTSNSSNATADINIPMTASQFAAPPLPQATKSTQDKWISNNAQLFFVARDTGVLQKTE